MLFFVMKFQFSTFWTSSPDRKGFQINRKFQSNGWPCAGCILVFLFVFPVFAESKFACKRNFVQNNRIQQFVETLYRCAELYKEGIERETFKSAVAASVEKGGTGKEILRRLIKRGHISMEHASLNPLFPAMIAQEKESALQLIEEHPALMYEGALLDNPPFFIAVFIGNLEIITAFLKKDPKLILSENSRGEKPLHYAWDLRVMTFLLHLQAPLNAQDKKGMTALHYVRSPENTEILLRFGADPSIKDRSGLTLFKYHEKLPDNEPITRLLQEAKAKLKTQSFSEKSEQLIQDLKKPEEPLPPQPSENYNPSEPTPRNIQSVAAKHTAESQKSTETEEARQMRIQKAKERKTHLTEELKTLETMETQQTQILTGLHAELRKFHLRLHVIKTSRLFAFVTRVLRNQANVKHIETRLLTKITDINSSIHDQSKILHEIQVRLKKTRETLKTFEDIEDLSIH